MSVSNKVILYQDNGGLCSVHPCECGIPVEEIARKDVPAGKPFLIVDVADLPTDPQYRDAWTADFTTPDGVGIGPEAWFAEQAAKNNGG